MASKICKIVYFDEDSVTDYVQIVAGGTLEKTTELLTSSDLGEEQKAYASAKGGSSGVFKALLGWEASASGEVSAGLALNRNKMVKNIVKNTILTDFLHIINENKSASKTTRGAIKKFDGYVISAEKDSLFRSRFSISVFFSGLPSSDGCLAFQSSSREMILSFISLGDLSLPKYFSSSALLMITLSTSFFSCDRIQSITSPLSLPSLSSSRIFCACDSEGEDCYHSMDTAIYL